MVEVSEILSVDANDFFDAITQSVVYDACQATGKKIRKSHLKKGFSYTKKVKNSLGKKENAHVCILEYDEPVIYKVKFEVSTGNNIMTYKIETQEDERIRVTYSEEFVSDIEMEGRSSKIMNAINEKRAVRRARKLLKNIERYILSDHEKNDALEDKEDDQS